MSSGQMSPLAVLLAFTAVVSLAGAVPSSKPGPFREVNDQGYRVRLDLSGQVLDLAIPEERGFGGTGHAEAPITPRILNLGSSGFVSASMLAQKAKQFDDGLYAAVELAAQEGAGRFAGKARMLEAIAARLKTITNPPAGNALILFYAGCRLGQIPIDVPELYASRADKMRDAFLADGLRSKPIAFYTWSDRLRSIFQQDRLYQSELKGSPSIAALARALHEESEARATYDAYLALVSHMTNPLAVPSMQPLLAQLDQGSLSAPEKGLAFLPPSRAYETDVIKKLYGNTPIPDGFNLVNEMIARIRDGRLSLAPTPESGWYDHQTWALEPLVIPDRMPEASHLHMDNEYRKQLLELFKGLLALTRETHIKQLEVPAVGAAAPFQQPKVVIRISPDLSAEPLGTYYERRADSYRFIRDVLTTTFGAEALRAMHRLNAQGPVQLDLAAELDQVESLFRGAAGKVSQQIGFHPQNAARDADIAAFEKWSQSLAGDPDLGQDVRMMVPVFYDVARRKTKVWVFLGWSQKTLIVSYSKEPKVEVFKDDQKVESNAPQIEFTPGYHLIPYPVTAEVYVNEILSRDEFRKLCDQYKTSSEIFRHLR